MSLCARFHIHNSQDVTKACFCQINKELTKKQKNTQKWIFHKVRSDIKAHYLKAEKRKSLAVNGQHVFLVNNDASVLNIKEGYNYQKRGNVGGGYGGYPPYHGG